VATCRQIWTDGLWPFRNKVVSKIFLLKKIVRQRYFITTHIMIHDIFELLNAVKSRMTYLPRHVSNRSRDSSVITVTRLRAGRRGFYPRQEQGLFFPFCNAFRPVLGLTQPPVEMSSGESLPRIKRLGREAIPPLLRYVFMACCLAKHRDNFTFTFDLPYH